MKTSCISHPEHEPLVVIHKWQVEFCQSNQAAAALLSFFEYWHNIKLEQSERAKQSNRVSEQHGEEGTQDASLYQFHTEEQLENGILIYKRSTISAAIKHLEELGVITVTKNPNPRYHFDKTRFFLFHPEVVESWLTEYKSRKGQPEPKKAQPKTKDRSTISKSSSLENSSRSLENGSRSLENNSAIPEITSETTTEREDAATEQGNSSDPSLSTATATATAQATEREEGDTGLKTKQNQTHAAPAPASSKGMLTLESLAKAWEGPNIFDEEPESASATTAKITGVRVPDSQVDLITQELPATTIPTVSAAKKLAPTANAPIPIFVRGLPSPVMFERQEYLRIRNRLLKLAGVTSPSKAQNLSAEQTIQNIAEHSSTYCTEAGFEQLITDYCELYKKPSELFVINWFERCMTQVIAGTIKPKERSESGITVNVKGKIEERVVSFNPDEY